MQKNVGGYERPARIIIGALLVLVGAAGYAGMVSLAFTGIGAALTAVILALIGVVLLATGWIQWCPITRALGINTYRGRADSTEEAPGDRTP